MKRQPDDQTVYDDDSGTFDVRQLRKEGRIVYVERSKRPDWLVGVATVILAGGIGAAWTANARLSALEAQVVDLRAEVSELKQLLAPHYRGGSDAPAR